MACPMMSPLQVRAAALTVPVNVGEMEKTNAPVPVAPVEVTPSIV